jgi:hypothetical protein
MNKVEFECEIADFQAKPAAKICEVIRSHLEQE